MFYRSMVLVTVSFLWITVAFTCVAHADDVFDLVKKGYEAKDSTEAFSFFLESLKTDDKVHTLDSQQRKLVRAKLMLKAMGIVSALAEKDEQRATRKAVSLIGKLEVYRPTVNEINQTPNSSDKRCGIEFYPLLLLTVSVGLSHDGNYEDAATYLEKTRIYENAHFKYLQSDWDRTWKMAVSNLKSKN